MKSYTFKVVLERDKWPDEPDEKAVWRAYVPCLEGKGGASWGKTKEEALANLQEALKLLLEDMIELGEPIPTEPGDEVLVFQEPRVTVTL
jgi:predicted RNase H-like HicB family nuclease